jgi:matrixin
MTSDASHLKCAAESWRSRAHRLLARRVEATAPCAARRTFAHLLLVAVVLWASPLALQAQRTAATRWPKGAPIHVWIDPNDAPPGSVEMVTRAVKTWSRAAGGRIDLSVVNVERGAHVRVHFISDPSRYGETAPRVDRRGTIVSADIFINGTNTGGPLEQRIVLYLTALHELGHALGLGHTNNFGDIMYAFRRPDDGERYFGAFRRRVSDVADIGSARATGLSPDDIAALLKLYAE